MIRVKVDHSEVREAFRALIAAGKNPKPVLADIGEILTVSTKRRFQTGRAPDGTPWAPNSEATLLTELRVRGGLSKHKTRTGGRTLTDRGLALLGRKRPLIGESRALSTQIFPRVTAHTVEVGSSREYAAVHQFGARKGQFGRTRRGAPIPWGDIPARPFLGISAQDHAAILEAIEDYLLGQS